MPVKKCSPASKTRKRAKACGPGSKGSCPSCEHDMFEGFMSDLTAHKLPVFVLMAAMLGLGALFSLMLGVSAASF